jgi:hypothetical protein
MRISPELIAACLHPLVGTPEATDAFAERLHVATAAAPSPYRALEQQLRIEINDGVATAALTELDYAALDKIRVNGMFGSQMTVRSLQTVGHIYKTGAHAPQHPATVQRSVHATLGHMYGLAHTGKPDADANMLALVHGVSPSSNIGQRYARLRAYKNRVYYRGLTVSPRSFVTHTDDEGQMDVRLKHRRVTATSKDYCPAVDYKAEGSHGRQQPGLYRLMAVIGTTILGDIYPREFAIPRTI